MHENIERVLVSEEELHQINARLGAQITTDYAGKNLLVVGILKGSVLFMADLIREIQLPCKLDFLAVSSYGGDTRSSGVVKIVKDIDIELEDYDVLLVEDNELNMEIAEFLLKKAGITVTTAYNGQEAVDVFRTKAAGTFDVILMDVMMPVMDGLTAAREIHATNRVDAAEIPIFAMTANAFYDDVRQSREAGMVEHLSKPIQEQELLDAIRRHVKR